MKKFKGESIFLIIVIILSFFGVLAIYSASNYSAEKEFGSKYYFSNKQLIGFAIGLIALIFTANYNYKNYKKFTIPLVVISLLILILVFVKGVGQESYGAKRWIKLGPITLQPSEIAKFAFIFFVSAYYSKNPTRGFKLVSSIPVIVVGGIYCLLIILEPNMSITVCFGLLLVTLLYLGGLPIKYFIIILIVATLFIPILIIAEPYRLKRLSAFINPWKNPQGEGYQLIQSLYALGSGGLFGVGFLKSRQKYKFLPFSESDFILSIIGEEFGYLGVVILFVLLFYLIIKCYKIASRSKDYYGFLIASGIGTIFFLQVSINALVVSGSIPPTGLPLPLISCGNTSLIVYMAAFGIVYNISKESDKLTL